MIQGDVVEYDKVGVTVVVRGVRLNEDGSEKERVEYKEKISYESHIANLERSIEMAKECQRKYQG